MNLRPTALLHALAFISAMLCCDAVAAAQNDARAPRWPTIREIAFEGNDSTRPKVMLREMVVAVGDPADPARIERSRQAIQDLGLFRRVTVRQEPVDDGVRLVFTVAEKWYVLPVPRFSYDSDGRMSYGGQVVWNNLQGLNDTLRLNWVRGDSSDPSRGREQTYSAGYSLPFVADSPWSMDLSGSFKKSPVEDPAPYQESFETAQTLFTRRLSRGPASQGWQAGGGLLWQNESRSGANAPPSYGGATAAVGLLSYRNLHYKVYSEQGLLWFARSEVAFRHVGSDYGYEQLTSGIRRYYAIGSDAHQSLNLLGDIGIRCDGPDGVNEFSLGGRSGLRAYPLHFDEGNAYYRVAAEYLHPIGWDWLRGLVVLEAGNVFASPEQTEFSRVHVSLGVGLRLRVTWLVNFEVEGGIAVPLDRRGSPRLFGGRV